MKARRGRHKKRWQLSKRIIFLSVCLKFRIEREKKLSIYGENMLFTSETENYFPCWSLLCAFHSFLPHSKPIRWKIHYQEAVRASCACWAPNKEEDVKGWWSWQEIEIAKLSSNFWVIRKILIHNGLSCGGLKVVKNVLSER